MGARFLLPRSYGRFLHAKQPQKQPCWLQAGIAFLPHRRKNRELIRVDRVISKDSFSVLWAHPTGNQKLNRHIDTFCNCIIDTSLNFVYIATLN